MPRIRNLRAYKAPRLPFRRLSLVGALCWLLSLLCGGYETEAALAHTAILLGPVLHRPRKGHAPATELETVVRGPGVQRHAFYRHRTWKKGIGGSK